MNCVTDKDEPEESFIIRRRKKPAALLLDVSSDQEDSTDKMKSKKTDSTDASNRSLTAHKIPTFLLSDGNDEEDFQEESRRQMLKSKVAKEKYSCKTMSEKGNKNAFIVEEAEVSGEDNSPDEHEEFDDYYDASFIDNNTEIQHMNETDMRAVYLKSVKSPLFPAQPGRFKLNYASQNHRDIDVYSQTQPEDQGMSEYEEDSFCVGSDERETSHTEEECPERFTKISKQPKKGKKLADKRRIQVMYDSSSDEDATHPFPLTQDFSTSDFKKVKKALLSSSEDEEAKLLSELSPNKAKILSGNATCDNISVKGNPNLNSSCEEKLTSVMSLEVDDMAPTADFDLLGDDDWYVDREFFHVDEVTAKSTETSTVGGSSFLVASKGNNKATAIIAPIGFTYQIDLKQTSTAGPTKYERNNLSHLNDSDADSASQCSELFFRSKKGQVSKQSFTKMVSEKGDKCDEPLLKNVRVNSSTVAANTLGIENTYPSGKVLSCSESSLGTIEKSINDTLHSPPKVDSEKMTGFNNLSTLTMTREERLKKQKEKQEEFQQRMQLKQMCDISSTSYREDPEKASSSCRFSNCINLTETSGNCPRPFVDVVFEAQVSTNFTKPNTNKQEMLQILVDSKEISGAQDIISALRIKHGIKVTARQISSCDYILSNHQAVDRVLWSAFSSSKNKRKLATRLIEMQALYDRCILIVEADRVKVGQEKSKKAWYHNKYVDTMMSQIIQLRVKIYFSDSMDQTASLLSELCHIEAKKGRALTVPTTLNSKQEEILKFILSIPCVTVPQALNLVHHYHSIAELISSSADVIQEKGRMTGESAQNVHHFLHHRFDIQMMPNSK